MRLAEAARSTNRILDLENQTPLISGDEPLRVLVVEEARDRDLFDVMLVSETTPGVDIWCSVKHDPLRTAHLHRRDHGFAWKPGHPSRVTALTLSGTPLHRVKDTDLARFETTFDLSFQAFRGHWARLVEIAAAILETPAPPPAWTAFEDLGEWLGRTDAETSALLGLGKKTAYSWRRDGHEPQARIARRVYQTHAFVRQLRLAVGGAQALTLLEQGGDDSALALIAHNRVADAEAMFADIIFERPTAGEVPLRSSISGDDDVLPATVAVTPQSGGRRRVQPGRGR